MSTEDEKEEALTSLASLVKTCKSALASLSKLSVDSSDTTSAPVELLEIVRKDAISLHRLIYSSTTRLSLSLGKPPPSYSIAKVPLKDLKSQVEQLTSCTFSFPPGVLRKEAVWAAEEIILALESLAQHFENKCRQDQIGGDEYLAKTGAIHDAAVKAEQLSTDETAAIVKVWKMNEESLEDSLREVREMMEKKDAKNVDMEKDVEKKGMERDVEKKDMEMNVVKKDAEKKGMEKDVEKKDMEMNVVKKKDVAKDTEKRDVEESGDEYSDGWDELGEGFGSALDPQEMQRVEKIYPLLRLIIELHEKLLSQHILKAPPSQPLPESHLKGLLRYSNGLLLASDDLASSLYAPQDVENIEEAAELICMLTQDLDKEMGVTERIDEKISAGPRLGSGAQRERWFKECFKRIQGIYNNLSLSK